MPGTQSDFKRIQAATGAAEAGGPGFGLSPAGYSPGQARGGGECNGCHGCGASPNMPDPP